MDLEEIRMKNRIIDSKHSQVTIFIIVALLIVGLVLLFFLLRGKIPIITETAGKIEKNPQLFLDSCISPYVEEAVDLLSRQGGYINSTLYKIFESEKVSYLCYTNEYYDSCVNQEPVLITHLEEEIKNYISKDVENCFQEMKSSLENRGYSVNMGALSFEVDMRPKKIIIDMKRHMELTKAGETTEYEEFKSITSTRFYDLAIVVQEIVSQEARFCNFDQMAFMLPYNEFNIDKFRTWDSTIIYTVEHRKTKEKFRFAVRSCVMPPKME